MSRQHAQLAASTNWHPGVAMIEKNEVLCCLGIQPKHETVGIAWSILSPMHWTRLWMVSHHIREHLALALSFGPWLRIEAWVNEDFEAGQRWAHYLGFTREGLMRMHSPLGDNQVLWAMTR